MSQLIVRPAQHTDVEVIAATPEDRPIVERLLQLYEYDVSDFMDQEVDPDGVYRIMDTDAIWSAGRHVFLIKVGARLAGFAFVMRHPSYLGDGETYAIDEFFVMRKYRRRGIGEYVARALFDRFPGRWEVAEARANVGSQAFWRTVIGRYTGGRFQDVEHGTPRWRGPIQAFESGGS